MKEILIYNVISNDSFFGMGEQGLIDRVVGEIKDANGEDILLRLSTPGGSVFLGQAIITHLKEYKGTINIIVDGLAASMGGVLLAFGDNVIADEHSMIMLHKAYGSDNLELLKTINLQLADMFKKNRAKNERFDAKFIDKVFLGKEIADYWLTSKEAYDLGLVDELSNQGANNIAASTDNLIDKYYSYRGNAENKIIYNNNNEVNNMFDTKEKKELEDKLTALQEEHTAKVNEAIELKAENGKLQAKQSELDKEIAKLNNEQAEKEELEAKADEIVAQAIEELKTSNKESTDAIAENKETIEALTTKVDNLIAQLEKTTTGFKVEDTQNGEDVTNLDNVDNKIIKINNEAE